MYDDGIDEVEFPTPVCSDTTRHAKHRIAGTWREECPGVEAEPNGDPDAVFPDGSRRCCATLPGIDHLSGCVNAPEDLRKRKLGDVTTAEWRAAAGLPEKVVDRESLRQWIVDQLADLTEAELLRVKAKLYEIVAGRPVVDRRTPPNGRPTGARPSSSGPVADMASTRHRLDADGVIHRDTEREWTAVGICRIARNRTTATVAVRLTAEGDQVDLTAVWTRQEPDEGRYANRWVHHDPDGGRWSVEHGYDGRYWCLFGPGGTPWGELLQNTIAASLMEATEYMARAIARAKDLGRLG